MCFETEKKKLKKKKLKKKKVVVVDVFSNMGVFDGWATWSSSSSKSNHRAQRQISLKKQHLKLTRVFLPSRFQNSRGRTGVQLKDKWRNLIKFQHLRRGEIESAPYKATVRAKQNAAAAAKGNVDTTKAPKSGGASGKTASAGKKRNAADQGGNIAKKKGKTNASGFKKGTNNSDLMDTFQKGPKGKRSKLTKGGRFGKGADGADARNIIDANTNLDHLSNGGEGIGRSISPALPPKKQAFKQQKKKMKLLAEARKKAGTPDAKARALHAPSNAPPRKRVAAAWAAGISDVNQIGSGGLLNSNINSLDEDEQDIVGAHLGHVTFDIDEDEDAHHLATTSGRGQNNKDGGAASSGSMARFTEEMEREIEQTKERRAQMVRDVECSERELARLKSLVEEAEKVYSEARLKAQETLQQAQKEIAEKRRKQSMESLEEQKKAAASDGELLEEEKKGNSNSDNNNKNDKKSDDDDNDGKDGHKSKGATTRKSLEASKQPKSATTENIKVDDDEDEPSNEDVSPKSVPNLNDVEDVEVDDAEWDKYLAFGGDNANEEDDEDMSEMQRAAQIASDEKKRKNYATDSETVSSRMQRLVGFVLFVVTPQAQHLDHLIIIENHIHQSVLDINAARIGALQVTY